jgi:hypothetical protein
MTTPKHKTETNKDSKTSRLNIILPKDFHKKIKQRALDEDITVTDLIYKAVEEYLEK